MITFLTFLSSCAPKILPLKNKYSDGIYETKSTADFETVWGKVIELFAKTGIGIKLIDKSSGLIVAYSATAPVTTEDANGKIKDPTAWVVAEKYYDPGPKKVYFPKYTDIDWNIYVKKDPDNKDMTIINVNLITPYAISNYYVSGSVFGQTSNPNIRSKIRSTGVFEKTIADKIK